MWPHCQWASGSIAWPVMPSTSSALRGWAALRAALREELRGNAQGLLDAGVHVEIAMGADHSGGLEGEEDLEYAGGVYRDRWVDLVFGDFQDTSFPLPPNLAPRPLQTAYAADLDASAYTAESGEP